MMIQVYFCLMALIEDIALENTSPSILHDRLKARRRRRFLPIPGKNQAIFKDEKGKMAIIEPNIKKIGANLSGPIFERSLFGCSDMIRDNRRFGVSQKGHLRRTRRTARQRLKNGFWENEANEKQDNGSTEKLFRFGDENLLVDRHFECDPYDRFLDVAKPIPTTQIGEYDGRLPTYRRDDEPDPTHIAVLEIFGQRSEIGRDVSARELIEEYPHHLSNDVNDDEGTRDEASARRIRERERPTKRRRQAPIQICA